MKALIYVPLAAAAALLLVAGVVFGLGDRKTLVPPPDSVVEGFVRELETERFERATSYLNQELTQKVGPQQLKEWTRRMLERTGDVFDVQGEESWYAGERAEAFARLKTERAGKPTLRFTLTREHGVWKIADLHSLETADLK